MIKKLILGIVFWTIVLSSVFLIGRNLINYDNATYSLSTVKIKELAFRRANFASYQSPGDPKIKLIFTKKDLNYQIGIQSLKYVEFLGPKFGIPGAEISYNANKYLLIDGKKERELYSFARVVRDVLSEKNIELAEEDKVIPTLDERAEQTIKIIRVNIAQIEKDESIPYQTKEIEDNTLERGKKKTTQNGKNGKKTLTYQITREDGIEVSRVLLKSEIKEKPEDKIIKIGTKVVVLSSISGKSFLATNHMTAMKRYKRGTLIRVTNRANGKTVEGIVKDHGPEEWTGAIMDLDIDLYKQIATSSDIIQGNMNVLVEEIKP